jgi:hypothetical protein
MVPLTLKAAMGATPATARTARTRVVGVEPIRAVRVLKKPQASGRDVVASMEEIIPLIKIVFWYWIGASAVGVVAFGGIVWYFIRMMKKDSERGIKW